MERKRITCPETAHLEELEFERTPGGIVIDGCSRFSPRCAVTSSRECARRMDLRDRCDRDDYTERVLVACTGADAQTAAIASALADELKRDGLIVDVADLDDSAGPPPSDYDIVVIASLVRVGHFADPVIAYVETHRGTLSAMPGFWISVSRSTGASMRALDRMFRRIGWLPTRSVTITRPSWRKRWFGGPTLADSSKIHEVALAIADEVPPIEIVY